MFGHKKIVSVVAKRFPVNNERSVLLPSADREKEWVYSIMLRREREREGMWWDLQKEEKKHYIISATLRKENRQTHALGCTWQMTREDCFTSHKIAQIAFHLYLSLSRQNINCYLSFSALLFLPICFFLKTQVSYNASLMWIYFFTYLLLLFLNFFICLNIFV